MRSEWPLDLKGIEHTLTGLDIDKAALDIRKYVALVPRPLLPVCSSSAERGQIGLRPLCHVLRARCIQARYPAIL